MTTVAHMVDASAYGRLRLRLPALRFSRGATVLQADMNAVAGEHEADVVYLDPPYNERQYVDCYHVLENIAAWQKPVLSGKTMKFETRVAEERLFAPQHRTWGLPEADRADQSPLHLRQLQQRRDHPAGPT